MANHSPVMTEHGSGEGDPYAQASSPAKDAVVVENLQPHGDPQDDEDTPALDPAVYGDMPALAVPLMKMMMKTLNLLLLLMALYASICL